MLVRIELFDGRVQTRLLKPGNATFIVPARRPAFEVLRDYLVMGVEHIFGGFDHVRLNGSLDRRLPGNLNVSFEYVEGESLILGMADVAVSSGSACTSAKLEPSHVLHALGVNEALARSSIRFGIGRYTTEAEIDQAFGLLKREVLRLREISPLYSSLERPDVRR